MKLCKDCEWNDGKNQKRSRECPGEEWKNGRLKKVLDDGDN
jgi:hypothetical protein